MKINRETFEAWLFSQPDDRTFDYWESSPDSKTGCLLCNFFRENYKEIVGFIGTDSYTPNSSPNFIPFEGWLKELLPKQKYSFDKFKAGDIKKRYVELFGSPISAAVSAEPIHPEPKELTWTPT